MAGWLVGWLAGWLAGWLVGCLARVNGVEWSDAHTHTDTQTHTHHHSSSSSSSQAVLKQSLIAPYDPHLRNATSFAGLEREIGRTCPR